MLYDRRIGSDTAGAEALGPTVVEIGAKSIPFDLRGLPTKGIPQRHRLPFWFKPLFKSGGGLTSYQGKLLLILVIYPRPWLLA